MKAAMVTEEQWQSFHKNGYLHLGRVLTDDEVGALKQRADDLAMGTVVNPDVQMQMDTGGAYEQLPAAVSHFEEGTRLYRKIQGLENDALFLSLIRKPVCLEVCAEMYGRHASISIFRAMIMNKPAGQGTVLPWHQDGGNVWALDRDPLVTIWVALDDATTQNGCMDCIPGSHRLGLLSLFGSTASDENVQLHCPPEKVQSLEVKSGHAILLHNWLIHRSGINSSPVPRRAFTMCCMDGRTCSTFTGDHFPIITGSLPTETMPFLKQLLDERKLLQQKAARAEAYATSLEADNKILKQMREEAEKYALSLEAGHSILLQGKAVGKEREEQKPVTGLEAERKILQQRAARAEEYAISLEADNKTLKQMREEAEKYALSLEAERSKLLQREVARKEREDQKRVAKLEAAQMKLTQSVS